jgi:hypothetical protein
MVEKNRQSPSGRANELAGTMATASTAVALTAAATATGTFAGARTGNAVTVSPQANLNASLAIAWARVVANDTICVAFSNVGASTNTGAITCDVAVKRRKV